jgi:hypothetical protein
MGCALGIFGPHIPATCSAMASDILRSVGLLPSSASHANQPGSSADILGLECYRMLTDLNIRRKKGGFGMYGHAAVSAQETLRRNTRNSIIQIWGNQCNYSPGASTRIPPHLTLQESEHQHTQPVAMRGTSHTDGLTGFLGISKQVVRRRK